MADPGFPRGGDANSKGGCEKLLFSRFLTKNCMKLKEFWLRGGHVPGAPLRSANGDHWQIQEGSYGGPHLCQISFIFLPNILPNNRFPPPTQGLVPVLEILDPPLETCNLLWIFAKHTFLISWSYLEQECIPVGCVPPAHWPYLRISSYPTHAPGSNHTPPWEQPCMSPLSNHAHPSGATTHAPPGSNYTPPQAWILCACFRVRVQKLFLSSENWVSP